MPLAQLNARLDQDLKREGDATLALFGVSATDAIRALWGYLATTKKLPDFMQGGDRSCGSASDSWNVEEGAGLAVRLANDRGLAIGSLQSMSYAELRDLALEEVLEEGACHV